MLDRLFKNATTLEAYRASPLVGPHLDSFSRLLLELGYASSTVQGQLWLTAEFGRWLAQRRLALSDLDEEFIEEFVSEPCSRRFLRRGLRVALRRFLAHLRERGASPPAAAKGRPSHRDKLEAGYERHLREERGVSAGTSDRYRSFARRFLAGRFGGGPLRLDELAASDVSDFVLRHAHSMSPGTAKLMVTALRSFLRFLLRQGAIGADLAASVPSVADWRLSALPRYLEPEQVERLLEACDRTRPTGRRDYALLLLLARLGLRACEAVSLRLEDIDWRGGRVRLRGKGCEQWLPLPADAGEALALYLREDRPRVATRRVFVKMRAPLEGFGGSQAVCTIVRRALSRAGLKPPFKGAHLLRHSLATGLLRRGASMREIGEVLRHQSAAATEIYAKVDIGSLRSLALPWPGKGGVR